MAIPTDGSPATGPFEDVAPVSHSVDALRETSVPTAAAASPVVVSSQRQAVDVPTRRVHVRVRQRLGDITQHYVGSVQIAGEPDGDRELQLDSSSSVEVGLAAAPLVFAARGFEPLRWSPPLEGAAATVHDIVLEPASSLRFFMTGLPVGAHEIQLTLRDAMRSFPFRRTLAGTAREPVTVAWCGGADVDWTLGCSQGSRLLRVHGKAVGLGLAEARDIHVDGATVTLQKHRLVGPSVRLMPHTKVVWAAGGRLEALPVADDGTFFRPADEQGPVSVLTVENAVEAVSDVQLGEVLCTLGEPLVGVQLVEDSGEPQPIGVVDERGALRGFEATTQLWPRRQLPALLLLRANGDVLTFSTAALREDADLLVLRRSEALPPTRLRVHVDGAMPDAATCQALRLCVTSDTGFAQRQPAASAVTFDLPRGGTLQVQWVCDGLSGAAVGRAVVAAGRCVDLHVDWPAVQRWTGEVDGFLDLPQPRRWHRVAFGEGDSVLSGWSLRLDANGRFVGHRFASSEPDSPVALAWGLCRVPATLTRRGADRHVVVRPADSLRWVDVTVDAPGAWRVQVMRRVAGAWPRIVHVMSSGQRWPVPVVGEEPPLFALEVVTEESTAVLAWGALPSTAGPVHLAAAPTRRIEVRTRATSDLTLAFVGPAGQCAGQQVVRVGEVLRVDVPFDTRGVLPWKAADGPEPQELPIPADGVVTID